MFNTTSGYAVENARMINFLAIVGDLSHTLHEAGVKYAMKLDIEESELVYGILEVISNSDDVNVFEHTFRRADGCTYRKISEGQYYLRIKFLLADTTHQ